MVKTLVIIGILVAAIVISIGVGLVAAQPTAPNNGPNPAQNMWAWMQNCYRWMTGANGPLTGTPANPTTNGPCFTRGY